MSSYRTLTAPVTRSSLQVSAHVGNWCVREAVNAHGRVQHGKIVIRDARAGNAVRALEAFWRVHLAGAPDAEGDELPEAAYIEKRWAGPAVQLNVREREVESVKPAVRARNGCRCDVTDSVKLPSVLCVLEVPHKFKRTFGELGYVVARELCRRRSDESVRRVGELWWSREWFVSR